MTLYRTTLLISAILLFLATLSALSLPYGYYTFLRIVVCGTALYAAYQIRDTVAPFLALLMVVVLFNPISPIYLPRQTWTIINLATAAAFLRLAFRPLQAQDK